MKEQQKSKLFNMTGRAYRENQSQFLRLVDKNSNARLLDIGCDDGEFTLGIARAIETGEVYGIEINPDRAKMALERGIKVYLGDANTPFPFENNFFDVVTANQLIEHLYNTENFLKEIYRVLKKGGYAIISTPNLCSWHNILFMLFGMQPAGMHLIKIQAGNFLYDTPTHGHIKLFSLKAIKDIVRFYGFNIERILVNGYYPFPKFIANFLSCLDKNHAVYFVIKIYKTQNEDITYNQKVS